MALSTQFIVTLLPNSMANQGTCSQLSVAGEHHPGNKILSSGDLWLRNKPSRMKKHETLWAHVTQSVGGAVSLQPHDRNSFRVPYLFQCHTSLYYQAGLHCFPKAPCPQSRVRQRGSLLYFLKDNSETLLQMFTILTNAQERKEWLHAASTCLWLDSHFP